MGKRVRIAGVGTVNFPDSMDEAQIAQAIETELMPSLGRAGSAGDGASAFGGVASTAPAASTSSAAPTAGPTVGAEMPWSTAPRVLPQTQAAVSTTATPAMGAAQMAQRLKQFVLDPITATAERDERPRRVEYMTRGERALQRVNELLGRQNPPFQNLLARQEKKVSEDLQARNREALAKNLFAGERPIKEGYEVPFKPEEASDLYIVPRAIKDVAMGTVGTLEGVSGAAEWAGLPAEKVTKTLSEWRKALEPTNPNFLDQVLSGAGSTLVFVPIGFGAGTLAGMAARITPRAASMLASSAAGFVEAAAEAGAVYSEVRGQKSEVEANDAATKTFWWNAFVNPVLNKMGIFGERAAGYKKALLSAPPEMVQEAFQQVVSNAATGRPMDEGLLESAGVGALIGFGGGMEFGGRGREEQAKVEDEAKAKAKAKVEVQVQDEVEGTRSRAASMAEATKRLPSVETRAVLDAIQGKLERGVELSTGEKNLMRMWPGEFRAEGKAEAKEKVEDEVQVESGEEAAGIRGERTREEAERVGRTAGPGVIQETPAIARLAAPLRNALLKAGAKPSFVKSLSLEQLQLEVERRGLQETLGAPADEAPLQTETVEGRLPKDATVAFVYEDRRSGTGDRVQRSGTGTIVGHRTDLETGATLVDVADTRTGEIRTLQPEGVKVTKLPQGETTKKAVREAERRLEEITREKPGKVKDEVQVEDEGKALFDEKGLSTDRERLRGEIAALVEKVNARKRYEGRAGDVRKARALVRDANLTWVTEGGKIVVPEIRHQKKVEDEVQIERKALPVDLVEEPVDKHPEPVKAALQQTAEQLKQEAATWKNELIGGGVRREGQGNYSKVVGAYGGGQLTTFPAWFSQLGVSKDRFIAALDKIIKNHGKDKGKLVEEVKAILVREATQGRERMGELIPPDEELSSMLDAYDQGPEAWESWMEGQKAGSQKSDVLRSAGIELAELIQRAQNIGNAYDAVRLHTIGTEEARRIQQATGLDVDGYTHVVDTYSIRHILRQHGDAVREGRRGQEAITESDLVRIPEIVSNYDRIENAGKDRRGLDTIRYAKKINGDVYLVEEVRTGQGELVPLTMYKEKAAGVSMSLQASHSTPEAFPAATGNLQQQTTKVKLATPAEMRAAAQAVIESFSTDVAAKVHVVEGYQDEFPESIRGQVDGRTRGLFDKETGDIYIVESAHLGNPDGIRKTILHEVVGHYGLRRTFGEKLNPFLDQLYRDRATEISEAPWFNQYVTKYQNYNPGTEQGKRNLAEEYVAYIAQNVERDLTTWEKVVAFVREMLRKIAPGMEWTQRDVEALVRRGYAGMKAKDKGEVKVEVKREGEGEIEAEYLRAAEAGDAAALSELQLADTKPLWERLRDKYRQEWKIYRGTSRGLGAGVKAAARVAADATATRRTQMGRDAYELDRHIDRKIALAKKKATEEIAAQFLNPKALGVLRKIFVTDATKIATTLRELPYAGKLFGIPRNRRMLLSAVAESVLQKNEDGTLVFGARERVASPEYGNVLRRVAERVQEKDQLQHQMDAGEIKGVTAFKAAAARVKVLEREIEFFRQKAEELEQSVEMEDRVREVPGFGTVNLTQTGKQLYDRLTSQEKNVVKWFVDFDADMRQRFDIQSRSDLEGHVRRFMLDPRHPFLRYLVQFENNKYFDTVSKSRFFRVGGAYDYVQDLEAIAYLTRSDLEAEKIRNTYMPLMLQAMLDPIPLSPIEEAMEKLREQKLTPEQMQAKRQELMKDPEMRKKMQAWEESGSGIKPGYRELAPRTVTYGNTFVTLQGQIKESLYNEYLRLVEKKAEEQELAPLKELFRKGASYWTANQLVAMKSVTKQAIDDALMFGRKLAGDVANPRKLWNDLLALGDALRPSVMRMLPAEEFGSHSMFTSQMDLRKRTELYYQRPHTVVGSVFHAFKKMWDAGFDAYFFAFNTPDLALKRALHMSEVRNIAHEKMARMVLDGKPREVIRAEMKKLFTDPAHARRVSEAMAIQRSGKRGIAGRTLADERTIDDLIDYYSFNYRNTPLGLEEVARSGTGRLMIPFVKSRYEQVRQLGQTLREALRAVMPDSRMTGEERLRAILEASFVFAIPTALAYMFKPALLDEDEPDLEARVAGRYAVPRGSETDRFLRGTLREIGITMDDGNTIFIRGSKYNFLQMGFLFRSRSDMIQVLQNEFLSEGIAMRLIALASGFRDEYNQYGTWTAAVGKELSSLVPAHRVMEDIASIRDPRLMKPQTIEDVMMKYVTLSQHGRPITSKQTGQPLVNPRGLNVVRSLTGIDPIGLPEQSMVIQSRLNDAQQERRELREEAVRLYMDGNRSAAREKAREAGVEWQSVVTSAEQKRKEQDAGMTDEEVIRQLIQAKSERNRAMWDRAYAARRTMGISTKRLRSAFRDAGAGTVAFE